MLGVHDGWIAVGTLSTASGVDQRLDGTSSGGGEKRGDDDRADELSDRNLISNLSSLWSALQSIDCRAAKRCCAAVGAFVPVVSDIRIQPRCPWRTRRT